ncbi:DoxX family protein [Belnapia rosea]|uniref:Putative oxidoreductase n=1 Tax=Belnapia rosea TaxID=938405 RepID=A0A1G6LAK9_9PROT|nr:DoxX family protein [Belnapia rosea]SDB49827.1 putative oxidoreductase [Belnapia rosea]SDC39606.1 putative oxidoreductase [Belnapia rosea]
MSTTTSHVTARGGDFDLVLLIGRIALVLLFPISAYFKIIGWPGIVTTLTQQGAPLPFLGGVIAVAAEIILPLLIIIGFQTRWAAFGLILYTLGTSAIAHRFWEFTGGAQIGQIFSFFKNLSMCGGFLILAWTGPGRYAVQPRP